MNQSELTRSYSSDINNYAFSIMSIVLMILCAICLYFVIDVIYNLNQSINKVAIYISEHDKNKSEY